MRISLIYRILFVILILFTLLFICTKLIRYSNESKWIAKPTSSKVSDSTGILFKGERIRVFEAPLERFIFRSSFVRKLLTELKCRKWAVLTTINEPSEAVRRFSYDPSWCLVIVGDLNSKYKDYKLRSSLGSNIIFLNDEDQRKVGSDFVNALPWRSFGRKNIGYLFAIAHGAEVIYDFDDDNMHKFWIPNSLPSKEFRTINDFHSQGEGFKTFVPLDQEDCQVFNPYPYLGGPNGSWPRGFPLSCLRGSNDKYKKAINVDIKTNTSNPIGVLQSLAENEPDVDAIYRLTQRTPFHFQPHDITAPGIILPYGIYSPFNAQATLHFPPAFFALYLPTSVSGRVSDILRSYVAKRLFDIFQIRAGFISHPLVVQIRNSHNILADFNAEIPLYTKASVLLNFLDSYKPRPYESVPNVILNLWIALYERGYVEETDVFIVQKWLQALLDIGYRFIKHEIDHNVDIKSNKIYNFDVGRPVSMTRQEIVRNNAFCKLNVSKIWSPDYEEGTNHIPVLDSSLTLSELQQSVYIGSSNKSQGTSYQYMDMSVSSVTNIRTKTKLDYFNELDSKINEYKVSQNLIQRSDIVYCHLELSRCLNNTYKNKTIGLILGNRYNQDKCKNKEWTTLNKDIINLNQNNGIIGALNRFDAEYLRHFTNIDARLFPLVGLVNDGLQYQKRNTKKSLFYVGPESKLLLNLFKKTGLTIETGYYLSNSKNADKILGIIYVPTSPTSYELNQIYERDIPIFSPSLEFLRNNGFLTSNNVCRSTIPHYYQTWHPSDPGDNQDIISQVYWWQLSDSFDLPHVIHFANEVDLKDKVDDFNIEEIKEKMRLENQIRKMTSIESWCSLILRTK